jgi:hypothetical protein
MTYTYGEKCGISKLPRASLSFGVNSLRFSSVFKLIHHCWRNGGWRMQGMALTIRDTCIV